MTWSVVYITAVLIAQYTAIWFIPLPVFGMVAIGTFVFGATFTTRDYVHKLGRRKVYLMIVIAILASVVLSFVGAVDWRIIVASSLAIGLSETADTEVYQRLLTHHWLLRVLGSNLVSIPIDSFVFNTVAFLGVFTLPVLAAIILGEIVTKFASGGIVALWRYLN